MAGVTCVDVVLITAAVLCWVSSAHFLYFFFEPGPHVLSETATEVWLMLVGGVQSALLAWDLHHPPKCITWVSYLVLTLLCGVIAGGTRLFGRPDIALRASLGCICFLLAAALVAFLPRSGGAVTAAGAGKHSFLVARRRKCKDAPCKPPCGVLEGHRDGSMKAPYFHECGYAAHTLADKGSEPGADAAACVGACALVARLLVLLCLILLAAGASIQGYGAYQYPPRGTFVQLTVGSASGNSGDPLHVLYHCQGARRAHDPVFVLDADGSHGLADFWPLQRELTRAGRRSCIFDKPGLGYSDYYRVSQHYAANASYPAGFMPYYAALIQHLHEEEGGADLILVGWGGGGENVYTYALKHAPSFVRGLAFIDTYGDNVEWRSQAHVDHLNTTQLNALKNRDLRSRFWIFNAIRLVAAPFGLLPLAMPGDASAYAWPERYSEYHWNYLVPKTWTTQWFSLLPAFDTHITLQDRGAFDWRSDALEGLPVLQIFSNPPSSGLCKNMTAAECRRARQLHSYMLADRAIVANVTGNPIFYACTEAQCSQDMPLRLPHVVSKALTYTWPLARGSGPDTAAPASSSQHETAQAMALAAITNTSQGTS